MSPTAKGLLLGIANAIVIAFAFGLSRAAEHRPCFMLQSHAMGVAEVISVITVLGGMAGAALGALIGSMEGLETCSLRVRSGCYAIAGNAAMIILVPVCPPLAPMAAVPTTLFAILLAQWTHEPLVELAPMRTIPKPRERYPRRPTAKYLLSGCAK